MEQHTHYATLGVPSTEREPLIHRAFRDLDRRYRPELAPPLGPRRYRETVHAYRVLHEARRREAYDRACLGGAGHDGHPEHDHGHDHEPTGASTVSVSIIDDFEGAQPSPSPREILDVIERELRGAAPKSGRRLGLELSVEVPEEVSTLVLGVPVFYPCPECHGAGSLAGHGCARCDGRARVREDEPVRIHVCGDRRLTIPLDGFGVHAVYLQLSLQMGRAR
jgi:DnaJ-class molecular chaperone